MLRPPPFILLLLCAVAEQMAAVAALCVQYEADFRPNMSIVVKALTPLLNSAMNTPKPQLNDDGQ